MIDSIISCVTVGVDLVGRGQPSLVFVGGKMLLKQYEILVTTHSSLQAIAMPKIDTFKAISD